MAPTGDDTSEKNWPALRRAGVLNTFVNKHVRLIEMADRRAQVMITINAFLIPFVASQLNVGEHRVTIIVFMVFALLSIYTSVISLLPKQYGDSENRDYQLFHFTGIQRFDEDEYLERMRNAFEDSEGLLPYVAYDLYHISTCILRPKFLWLRISYFTFLTGLSISLLLFCLL